MHHGLELTVLFWVIPVLQKKVYKIFPFKITKAFFFKIFLNVLLFPYANYRNGGANMWPPNGKWATVLPRTLWEQTDGPGIPRTGAPSSCCLHSGRRCRACAALSQPSTTCLWSDLGGREKNPECNKRDAEITRAGINRQVYRIDEEQKPNSSTKSLERKKWCTIIWGCVDWWNGGGGGRDQRVKKKKRNKSVELRYQPPVMWGE